MVEPASCGRSLFRRIRSVVFVVVVVVVVVVFVGVVVVYGFH